MANGPTPFRTALLAGCGVPVAGMVAGALLSAHPAAAQGAFEPLPLQQVARNAPFDPVGIWTPAEMTEDPKGADLYIGRARTPDGDDVIISQLVSAGCASPSSCPVRVVLVHPDGTRAVLLNDAQMCAAPATFRVAPDLSAVNACDEAVRLAPVPAEGASQ